MKKDENTTGEHKKKLVLRKESIQALDNTDLSLAVGGAARPPPKGGPPLDTL